GTPGLSPADVSERLEKLGVRLQVGTSWEVAHLEFTSLAQRVAEASDLVARLVQAPAFPPDEVERLRNHQVAGILQRRAEPRGFANELAARFIFADESPFSRPLHGYSATVVGLTREDVQGFHAATYSPQGAALVVAGNLDPAAVLE